MKTKFHHLPIAQALLAISILNPHSCTTFAQGVLSPPGAPAPTMKTLSQIEPRTDVQTLAGNASYQFIINQSGSYYLTTNITGVANKNGIGITANDVTLDLNGFALLGGSGTLAGILFPGAVTNVTVRNGTIHGWGANGVDSAGTPSFNLVCDGLNISSNATTGINAWGGACVVRNCNCQNNSFYGMDVQGDVTGCTVNDNFTGLLLYGGTASRCTLIGNKFGMLADPSIVFASDTVSGCFFGNNTDSGAGCGIQLMGSGCLITGNTFVGNDTGIVFSAGNNNRVEDNHISASVVAGMSFGSLISHDNIIIKNSVSGSGTNNFQSLNVYPQITGPIITNAVSGIITNSNPWANFSF